MFRGARRKVPDQANITSLHYVTLCRLSPVRGFNQNPQTRACREPLCRVGLPHEGEGGGPPGPFPTCGLWHREAAVGRLVDQPVRRDGSRLGSGLTIASRFAECLGTLERASIGASNMPNCLRPLCPYRQQDAMPCRASLEGRGGEGRSSPPPHRRADSAS